MGLVIKTFVKELGLFMKNNYRVFFIFLFCLGSIWYTKSGNIYEVLIVFMLHFMGDICMMMMGDFYARGDKKKALWSQIVSNLFFLVISFINYFSHGIINYFLANIMFGNAGAILYARDEKKINNFFTSFYFSVLINIIVFIIFVSLDLVDGGFGLMQVLGFMVFSAGLTLRSESRQYFTMLAGLFLQVLGSAGLMHAEFLKKSISGAAVSFTLLPFVVLVYYLKNINNHLPKKK